MEDQTAVALEIVRDDRYRLAIVAAAYVEIVAAQTAIDLDIYIGRGALNKEGVIAFQRIDNDSLEPAILDIQATTENSSVGHHEIVTKLGANNSQGIEAVAAINVYRRIDGIGYEVRSLATVNICERRFRIVRIDAHECPNDKTVI